MNTHEENSRTNRVWYWFLDNGQLAVIAIPDSHVLLSFRRLLRSTNLNFFLGLESQIVRGKSVHPSLNQADAIVAWSLITNTNFTR